MGWSTKVMYESFLMSNISPQRPGFNRGLWKMLEQYVRKWVESDEPLCIVTGPVLEDGLQTIGMVNKISVPKYFFKVVLDYTEPEVKAIGFIMPNMKTHGPFTKYAM